MPSTNPKRLFVFFILAMSLLPLRIYPQERPGSLTIYVYYNEQGGYWNSPAQGAVAELISGGDTLHTAANFRGQCIFRRVAPGSITFNISHIGYKTETRTTQLKPGENKTMSVALEDAPTEIDEVKVKGEAPPLTIRGDTLVFNASAVNTLEGDEVIEILRQMPGVEVADDGAVSVMGEDIKRTYVNGKLLFGSDPKAALTNLLASEVVNIKFYEEATVEDRKREIKRTGDMERVLDIKTKTPILSVSTGHFLASGGSDFTRNDRGDVQKRYGAGLTANFFSEKLLISTNTFLNNVNRNSNRVEEILNFEDGGSSSYNRTQYAAFTTQYYWGERWKEDGMELSYSYSNDYRRTGESSEYNYFPTENYNERLRTSSSQSLSRTRLHEVNLNTGFNTRHLGEFSTRTKLSTNKSAVDSYQRRFSSQDATVIEDGAQRQNTTGDGYVLNQDIDWRPLARSENAAVYPLINLGYDISKTHGTWERDNSNKQQQNDNYTLASSPYGLSRDMRATAMLSKILGADRDKNLYASYNITSSEYRNRQYAFQHPTLYPGWVMIDESNSWNHTYNYLYNNGSVGMGGIFTNLLRGSIGVEYQNAKLRRDERFPDSYHYGQTFNSVKPYASIQIHKGYYTPLIVMYNTNTYLPSVEQLSDRVDNKDKYNLRGGNPDLKKGYEHRLFVMMQTSPTSNGNQFNGNIWFSGTTRAITQRSYFFSQETVLPQYQNYLAPANSYLSVYDNIDGNMDLRLNASYDAGVKPIKGRFTAGVSYNYNKTPGYTDNERSNVYSNRYGMWLTVRGSHQRDISFHVSMMANYNQSWGTVGQDYKFLTGTVYSSVRTRFLKRFFANANYRMNHHSFISGGGENQTHQKLSGIVGFNFYKNNGAVSLAGFDLLNKSTSYGTMMTRDYISNSWQPSFGRYWTVNLSFKFNTQKTGSGRGTPNTGGRTGQMGMMGGVLVM